MQIRDEVAESYKKNVDFLRKSVKSNKFDLSLRPWPLTYIIDILQVTLTELVKLFCFCFVKIDEELTEIWVNNFEFQQESEKNDKLYF